jgi:uroporphyrinogen-III synthase
VLITSANGARALAEASEQRSKPIFAVGDTTAADRRGAGLRQRHLGVGRCASLADLVRERLDPANGPLLHVAAPRSRASLRPTASRCSRVVLYEAREADACRIGARRRWKRARSTSHLLLAARREAFVGW